MLPGVMRGQILNSSLALDAPVSEAMITREMLYQADALMLSNALRGVLPAWLVR